MATTSSCFADYEDNGALAGEYCPGCDAFHTGDCLLQEDEELHLCDECEMGFHIDCLGMGCECKCSVSGVDDEDDEDDDLDADLFDSEDEDGDGYDAGLE